MGKFAWPAIAFFAALGAEVGGIQNPYLASALFAVCGILLIWTLLTGTPIRQLRFKSFPMIGLTIFIISGAVVGGSAGAGSWFYVKSQNESTLRQVISKTNSSFFKINSEKASMNERWALVLFNFDIVNSTGASITIRNVDLVYMTSDKTYQAKPTRIRTDPVTIANNETKIFVRYRTDLNTKLAERQLIPDGGVLNSNAVFILERGTYPGDLISTQLRIADFSGNLEYQDIQITTDWRGYEKKGLRLVH